MDVKSAFLYGKIEKEVYVCQPPGFEDPDFSDRRGKIDKTLFIRRDKGNILLVQVYVDDIIFGSTKKSLCTKFEKIMHKKFQMSYIGELIFFLGLQVKQKEDGIFISQDKYVTEILNKFGFTDAKTYPKDSPFDLVAYTDSDYDGVSLDRKSTIGGCQFLGCRLISWQCKKQNVVANSTTKAEYIAASNCCGQIFGNMKREGKGFSRRVTPLFPTMMVQTQEEIGEGSANPIDPHRTPIITQLSTSQPQKKEKPKKPKRKDTEIPQSSGPT
ncbi:putative ribonuclease H-like domain-containing protein [Tanacetum coccineum]